MRPKRFARRRNCTSSLFAFLYLHQETKPQAGEVILENTRVSIARFFEMANNELCKNVELCSRGARCLKRTVKFTLTILLKNNLGTRHALPNRAPNPAIPNMQSGKNITFFRLALVAFVERLSVKPFLVKKNMVYLN
jgi:hypothetical protein